MNKKNLLVITIILTLIFLNIFLIYSVFNKNSNFENQNQIIKEIKSINQQEFISKMENLNEDNIIIDVRTKVEFDEFHFKNALNIDYYKADFKTKLNQLNKNKTYLIYCRSGNRSGETLKIMKEMGFKNVYDLNGGISNCNIC